VEADSGSDSRSRVPEAVPENDPIANPAPIKAIAAMAGMPKWSCRERNAKKRVRNP
jgi:hypothetical protein